MQNIALVENYFRARYLFFQWRYSLTLANKIALALGMACLTGLAAQMRIPLAWTPVPITGQTFAVLLSGVLLGRRWGGASMVIYAGLGFVGVPWFSNWQGGLGVLIGPTGGYIIGFIFAALFVGYFTDTFINFRRFFPMLGIMLLANFVIIHGLGLLQLGLWLHLIQGEAVTFSGLLMMGSIPFIPGGVIKAVAAALITKAVTPKRAYGGELDSYSDL
ncbi:biotin transporter BioY [candidate division NPL-UPA2 bacterium]|nr:biotin transporter BioY [candidate division NPL-UPA2 bacterium]